MPPAAPRIAILGQYKTGTTALFYQIRPALPPDAVTLFEPKEYRPTPDDEGKAVLAKVILGLFEGPDAVAYEDVLSFPHKVVILRDPRDRIISGGLFITQQSPQIYNDPRKLSQVLELLRQKEASPGSVSFKSILSEILHLAGGQSLDAVAAELLRHQQWIFEFESNLRDHFLLKYEDLVDGRVAPLEAYLGLRLATHAPVAAAHDHVVRTRKHGDWKNWFLEDDVEFFRPVIEPYLRHFNYPDDWVIDPSPVVPSGFSSEYVQRTVNRRRQKEPKWYSLVR